jgi:hypothetical protein
MPSNVLRGDAARHNIHVPVLASWTSIYLAFRTREELPTAKEISPQGTLVMIIRQVRNKYAY